MLDEVVEIRRWMAGSGAQELVANCSSCRLPLLSSRVLGASTCFHRESVPCATGLDNVVTDAIVL